MNPVQGSVVLAAYIAQVTGEPLQSVCVRRGITDGAMHESISRLNGNNLMEGHSLTPLGRDTIKVVLTGGVFDIIHPGHIHTLNAAKSLGDILAVVVATDKTTTKTKGRKILHTQEQRRTLVESLRIVDIGIIGYQDDIFKTVKNVMPDVVALGYDQAHHEKHIADGCRLINPRIQIARLQSPIPDISSSDIKQVYGDNIHDI